MPWRLIEVLGAEVQSMDLTDGELIGVSVTLIHQASEFPGGSNVYLRAWEKIQPQVNIALDVDR